MELTKSIERKAEAGFAGAHGSATWCPECREQKPRSGDDLHDIVLMRMDWRKAGRPERTKISDPVGQSPMCLECNARITIEYAPKAPTFDKRGDRLPNDQAQRPDTTL